MDKYDVGIVGAGVAGSCLAILLADAGLRVAVLEKEEYPKHKVCGEFVSLESYDFFKELGLPLDNWNLPHIHKLRLTSQKGAELNATLKMGGFGISRHKLDYELAKQMIRSGVHFFPSTKVFQVTDNEVNTSNGVYTADLLIGAHGKYAPAYLPSPKQKQKNNYIGVKYHITGDFAEDLISLHSFDGGYCGMSNIEDEKYCLCYLVSADKLKDNHHDINELDENVLFKNKILASIFQEADFVWEKPLVISNVKFSKQSVSNNNMLFVGDAAGSISPLSGNGMSIAARSALILSQLISKNLPKKHQIKNYNQIWDKNFGKRVNQARFLNTIMLNPTSHHAVLHLLNGIKPLRNKVINDMQGERFVRNTPLTR